MRLPASVLGTLRVGLGATALIAGCDAPQALEPALPEFATPEVEATTQRGLAAEVTALVERTATEAPVPREVFAAVRPVVGTLHEDLTAFVPFEEEPADAAPIRPRIRPRVRPQARPRVETRPVIEPPKWSDDGCPACGRG